LQLIEVNQSTNSPMINVAVSGALGRLGRAISSGIAAAKDMRLTGLYAPGHEGKSFANISVSGKPDELSAQVIVECAHPDIVMDNLKTWHEKGFNVVVGTSGFTENRLAELGAFNSRDYCGCAWWFGKRSPDSFLKNDRLAL
jgi:4-hydroxy-tetrahydrodipicolinate reductase